ncbi:PHB depolymerase family esterase [Cognatishimia sp.]|uniref:alpha/beta hydrolase family esterase n=1 Tax=Cognatishimia sp. TaxID=2211648 RepID=UPI003513A7B2
MTRILVLIWVILSTSQLVAGGVHEGRSFHHDGAERVYFLHVPKGLPDNAPLLVALHGLGGDAGRLRYGLGFNELADQYGFAVLYPQGARLASGSRHWNPGFDFSQVDDFGFLTGLIAHVAAANDLNAEKVYVLGISNGGYMAYHLACRGANVAGIASVIGMIGGRDWQNCNPRRQVRLLHIHGRDDPVIRFQGIPKWSNGWGGQASVPDVVAQWATQLQDVERHDGTNALGGLDDPASLQITSFEDSQGQPQVALIAIDGFGHDWPFTFNTGLDTATTIVEFFFGEKPP